MKKIMTMAAAAALCGTLFAEGGIASANIVGYKQDNAQVNLSAHMVPFAALGTDGIDLQTLIPQVASGTLRSGDFVIQYYDQYGVIDHSYYYLLAPDTDEEEKDGWWDDPDGVIYSTKKLNIGEGFTLNDKVAGSITEAGEVDGAEYELPIPVNLSHQGNIRPAKVSLQTILPEVNSGSLRSGDFVIQYYDQYGVIDHSYYYLLAPDTDEEEKDGWWDDPDGVIYSTKVFEPGEGFWMSAKVAGKLVFPALSL